MRGELGQFPGQQGGGVAGVERVRGRQVGRGGLSTVVGPR